MKDFFKDYWLWILVPFLVVIGGIVALYWMSGSDSVSPFQYNVF